MSIGLGGSIRGACGALSRSLDDARNSDRAAGRVSEPKARRDCREEGTGRPACTSPRAVSIRTERALGGQVAQPSRTRCSQHRAGRLRETKDKSDRRFHVPAGASTLAGMVNAPAQGPLFRVVFDDGSQGVFAVPVPRFGIEPVWTSDYVTALGQPIARKEIGRPWMGLLPGVDPKTGKPALGMVPLTKESQDRLSEVRECPRNLALPEAL